MLTCPTRRQPLFCPMLTTTSTVSCVNVSLTPTPTAGSAADYAANAGSDSVNWSAGAVVLAGRLADPGRPTQRRLACDPARRHQRADQRHLQPSGAR